MRILNLGTWDSAGDGIRTKDAFDRHAPGWTYNATAQRQRVFAWPEDRPWRDAPELALRADVLHLRNSFKAARQLGLLGRPAVIHHHGTAFRKNQAELLDHCRRHNVIGLAATLDLWLMAPDELEWLPAPYDLDWLAAMRQPRQDDGVLRIAHAPTNRQIKGTDAFLRAVDKLAAEIPVELVLIEGRAWAECLPLKATADIYYDQVALGYGNNSIESWAMGIPVVCGGADETLSEYERRFGSLPFVLADEGSIYHALRAFADPDERAHWAARGLDHVTQWHDEKRVVTQLQQVYARAAR